MTSPSRNTSIASAFGLSVGRTTSGTFITPGLEGWTGKSRFSIPQSFIRLTGHRPGNAYSIKILLTNNNSWNATPHIFKSNGDYYLRNLATINGEKTRSYTWNYASESSTNKSTRAKEFNLVFTPESASPYFLAISPGAAGSYSSKEFDYQVSLSGAHGILDSKKTAQRISATGTTVTGSIETKTDFDYYYSFLSASKTYTFKENSDYSKGDSNIKLSQLTEGISSRPKFVSKTRVGDEFLFTPTTTGNHYFLVNRSSSSSPLGKYTFSLNTVRQSFDVTTSSRSIFEGQNFNTNIKAMGYAPRTRIYWEITGRNKDSRDIYVWRGAGSLDNQGELKLTHKFEDDKKVEGTEYYKISIYDSSRKSKLYGSSNFSILDKRYTYSLSAQRQLIEEGDTVNVFVNGAPNSYVYWALKDRQGQSPFDDWATRSGAIYLNSTGKSSVKLWSKIDKDYTESNERFTFNLYTDPKRSAQQMVAQTSIAIKGDTSYNYKFEPRKRQIEEGDNLSIDITGKPNSYVFWRISKVGKDNDFSRHEGATYLARNGRGTATLYSKFDYLKESKENFVFDGYSTSARSASGRLGSANISIYDKGELSPNKTIINNTTNIVNITNNTFGNINSYARSLVGNALRGSSSQFNHRSFDAKFYNLGEGRYGVQKKGESSIDEITGVSSLQFQDQALSLANDVAATFNQVKGIDDVSGVVFRLYNAAFARLPDAKGLENWINGNSLGGMTYAASAQEFSSSQEFKNRYGATTTDTQYITTLYNNVLERSPDAAGLANYQNLLANGKTRGALLLDFSESPENRGLFTKVTGLS